MLLRMYASCNRMILNYKGLDIPKNLFVSKDFFPHSCDSRKTLERIYQETIGKNAK